MVEDPGGELHIAFQLPGQPWISFLELWEVKKHWDGGEVAGNEQAMLGGAVGD